MSKEVFEALERIKTAPSFMGGTIEYQRVLGSQTPFLKDIELVEQDLKRLEKHDKLEEELGCPFDVIVKARKQNKIYVESAYCCGAGEVYDINKYVDVNLRTEFTYCEEVDDYFEEYANQWCFYFEFDIDDNNYTWDNYLVKLSDYKKTWWLKEDRSE